MARFASLSVLALVAILAGSTLALPYKVEMAQAQAALKATPGYKLFAANMKNISVYANQYSTTLKNPPVTMFIPNDAAVLRVLASLTPTQAVLTQLIGQHIVKGAWPMAKLAALRAGTPLVTFTRGKVLIKVSLPAKYPIMLKGAKPVITSLAVKPIYQGQFICMYGATKVVPL